MASSLQRKADFELRRVTADSAVAHPKDAPATDESPTVISKTPPLLQPSSSMQKITDLARKPTTPDSIVASLRGRRLAHYELIEPIGVGGMAAVIRAHDTQLDRFVALKILPPEMATEPENVERFHQEARAAAKLDHENIARVFFCGEDQGLHFIAFEFVEGINLRTMMDRRGRIPVGEAVRYILQVATGLEHASARGVVHRDVKPSNIIVTPTGRAKLVDMGLARNLERHGDDLTQSGVTLGTFDYISPEQALEPREADARSDIYSLGCTFYHLLTGMAPVPEGTPAKKLDHHQHHAPTDPREIDPKIPTEIVMILGKMMAKKPSDRYQRPIDLVHHLLPLAKDVGAVNDVPEGVLFVDTPLPGQMQKRPLLAIGLSLAALVVITLLLSMFADPNTPRRGGTVVSTDKNGPTPTLDKQPPNKEITPPKARPEVALDRDELKRVLDDVSERNIKAKIEGTINVESGLTFKGGRTQHLTLDAEDISYGPVFHFTNLNAPSGLLIEGGEEVVFKNLLFKIQSTGIAPKEGTVAAAITLRGARKVSFQNCVFAQPIVPALGYKKGPLASIFIDTPENADHPHPIVNFKECLFDNQERGGHGQVAIAIKGAATVNLTDCAFMPHAMLFQFRDGCKKEHTSVHMSHCDSFIVGGPAFRFNPKTAAQIFATDTVFSRPDLSPLVTSPSPNLVMPQAGLIYLSQDADIEYVGEKNYYHNLNHFVERPSKESVALVSMDARPDFLAKTRGKDQNAHIFAASASPRQNATAQVRAEKEFFQLKPEYFGKAGLTRWKTGELMDAPKLDLTKVQPTPKSREKIVDAEDGGKTPGVRASLGEALAGVEDGDTILIKTGADAEVIMPPTTLRSGISIVLKAFKDHEPIVVLDKGFKDKESFLFKLQDGKLQIEDLEIVLDPGSASFDMQSIVQLGDSAHCVFKRCCFTLRGGAVPLNVATFVDLDRMMKTDASNPGAARVEFHECFVRGKGDLVGLNSCRMLHVDVKNSLIALDGSLLDIRAAKKGIPMSQGVRWKMERSTVFTTESLFSLQSFIAKGLTETHADVEGCLLVSLNPKQPVIDFGLEEPMERYLKWRGEQNYYANFEKDAMVEWTRQFPEMRSANGRYTFADFKDDKQQTLRDAIPAWFRPIDADMERLADYGLPAALEKRMMPPSSKSDEP